MLYYVSRNSISPKSKPKLTGKQYNQQLDDTYFRKLEIQGPTKLTNKKPFRDSKHKDPNSGSTRLRMQSLLLKNYQDLPALFYTFYQLSIIGHTSKHTHLNWTFFLVQYDHWYVLFVQFLKRFFEDCLDSATFF